MDESTALPPPPSDGEPAAVPQDFHGFCPRCHYNLRGLAEPRCPECGRGFDPADPRTYSFTPRSDRLRKAARRASGSLLETIRSISPPDPEAARRMAVSRQLTELRTETLALSRQVSALTALLLAKGLIDAADLEAVDREVEEALSGPQIVDDTEPPEEEAAEPTPDLLELGRAAHAGEGEP